jgi:hypothetical protein
MDSYEKIIEWLARMDCIRILKYTEEVVIFYLLNDDNTCFQFNRSNVNLYDNWIGNEVSAHTLINLIAEKKEVFQEIKYD